jgi:hypothetical protein
VGLLNYPNSFVPPILASHTSGTYGITGVVNGPFTYIPSVGFSDIEFFKNAAGVPVLGQFLCLSDNGYGTSANSADYALNMVHMRISKPFTYRHGESTFERYTQTTNLNTILLSDPNNRIKWENGADIQVTYKIPDATWNDYKANRVLTGRDFDVEGLAVVNSKCAIVGEELMPAIFAIDPSTGFVTSNFVRTPDINPATGAFVPNKFLSTRGDKVHCNITVLQTNPDACNIVPLSTVDASAYRRHDQSGGYEGFAFLADGSIAAFLEKNDGDSTLNTEPGVRVYQVNPGNCTATTPPSFTKFMGYYQFETNANAIADVSGIPGSNTKVVVTERNGYPAGSSIPAALMPANKICVVDLADVGPDLVFRNKKCVLNYHNIDDPWDVDGNGILKYALTQITNEQLIVLDDYCILAGTDTNFPGTNQFNLNISQVPDWQFVTDSRWMIVCFIEPIFDLKYPILEL